MLGCPHCATALRATPVAGGTAWACPACGGLAVMMPVLRQAAPREFVHHLWLEAKSERAAEGCLCPSCRRPGRAVDVPLGDGIQTLDVCLRCHVVWFDPGEFRGVPQRPAPPEKAAWGPEAAEVMLRFEAEHSKVMSEGERDSHLAGPIAHPDAWWKYLPGLFGLPVELEGAPTARPAWATYGVMAVVAVVSLIAFTDPSEALRLGALLPAEPWRHGGVTWITHFFLHADWLHLVGNLYFLWIFGDNVEDHLGHARYLGLLLVATVAGVLVHAILTDDPQLPCIGSSGGISGIVVFYALQYPRVRLGQLFFYVYWLRFPAFVGLFLWIGLQVLGLLIADSNVAYGAHLGGALVGLLAWLVAREWLRPRTR